MHFIQKKPLQITLTFYKHGPLSNMSAKTMLPYCTGGIGYHGTGSCAYELDYKSRALDTEDEFFLFMIKLRLN